MGHTKQPAGRTQFSPGVGIVFSPVITGPGRSGRDRAAHLYGRQAGARQVAGLGSATDTGQQARWPSPGPAQPTRLSTQEYKSSLLAAGAFRLCLGGFWPKTTHFIVLVSFW